MIEQAKQNIGQCLEIIHTNSPKSPDAGRWSGPHCAAVDRCGLLEEREREPTQCNKLVSQDTGKTTTTDVHVKMQQYCSHF